MSEQSKPKRVYRKEALAYWGPWFEKWEKSGKACSKFCEEHQLSLIQFKYWYRKQKEDPAKKERFLPVSVAPYSASSQLLAPIRVQLPNQVVITIPIGALEKDLKSLFCALGVPSC